MEQHEQSGLHVVIKKGFTPFFKVACKCGWSKVSQFVEGQTLDYQASQLINLHKKAS